MIDEFFYEAQFTKLGRLQRRRDKLENEDYMTAFYKGYSKSGQTLEEIKDEIEICP